jgi:putative membrane protein insertion efficiency factor
VLPRNKALSILLVFFALSAGKTACAGEKNVLFRFYQNHISVVDGNRCSMFPSCSQYALDAFEKHGPILGWVMTCDRLVRCGRDEAYISPQISVNQEKLIYDPVTANDFWWKQKTK